MDQYVKYQRILHLPWSPGLQHDDRLIPSLDGLKNRRVIVTEKLDGECTIMYQDRIHARSIDSKDHPSRHWVKRLYGTLAHDIPTGWRICGENVFAKHSILYDGLTSYFYVFGIFDQDNNYLAWEDVVTYCNLLGLQLVPVLYEGMWEEEEIHKCFRGNSVFGDSFQEGYVVKVASSFSYEDFQKKISKYVRKSHVQTSENWMTQPVVPNIMLKEVTSI